MILKDNTILQGGRYIIQSTLGQGGFGITYLALQVELRRNVVIKEFFMNEYCDRDENSLRVSLGTSGSRETVVTYLTKFLKEARNIASLKHNNIISIYDVFEENGTAYYVMEYHSNGSLGSLVNRQGAMSESSALRYIRQVASALSHIHNRRIMHLDIKPANILLDDEDNAVLIDFGLAKSYDNMGKQTSSTPVGISHGYAPMEQYSPGGVGEFSPPTDIYSLGATLFTLLTGETPHSALVLSESNYIQDELRRCNVSSHLITAVTKAMSFSRRARPQSVDEFLSLLDVQDFFAGAVSRPVLSMNGQRVKNKQHRLANDNISKKEPKKPFNRNLLFTICAALLCIVLVGLGVKKYNDYRNEQTVIENINKESIVAMEKAHQDSIIAEQQRLLAINKAHKDSIIEQQLLAAIERVRLDSIAMQQYNDSIANLSVERYPGKKDFDITSRVDGKKFIFTVNGVKFTMVYVEGGTFNMGSKESEAYSDEKPVHTVTLNSYYIAETETTQELWKAVMGSNPSHYRGNKNPVEQVSYNDCIDFIKKLNTILSAQLPSGCKFRLPTEAQWEFAARGGNKSYNYKFSGSDNIYAVAWFNGNSGKKTHTVKSKQPNELGLYDMTGNVFEWCYDWKGDYSSISVSNPTGRYSGSLRVLRGGSWGDRIQCTRVTYRNSSSPGHRNYYYGLRLAIY